MKEALSISLLLAIPIALSAQTCGFSEGKNLAELRSAVYAKDRFPPLPPFVAKKTNQGGFQNLTGFSPIFLPRWSADELPFFCKIEHDWGARSSTPFKFRLGSVEYVDWLEGK